MAIKVLEGMLERAYGEAKVVDYNEKPVNGQTVKAIIL